MKTPLSFPRGRIISTLLTGSILSVVLAAQPPPPAPPPPDRTPTKRPEFKLFGDRKTPPPAEPEITEIIPDDVARARALQRAKELQELGSEQTPPSATSDPAKTADVKRAPSPSRGEGREEQKRDAGAPREEDRSSAESTARNSVSVEKKSPPTESETRATPEERKPTARRSQASQAKGETDTTTRQIEMLQREVKELKKEVAETRSATSAPAPSESASAPTPPDVRVQQTIQPHTAPLTISTVPGEERKPIVIDTPPKIEIETPATPKETEPIRPAVPSPVGLATENASAAHAKPGVLDTIPTESDVPVATETDKPGFVTSPFPPHKVIEVTGLPKGSRARDPITQKVFRVP